MDEAQYVWKGNIYLSVVFGKLVIIPIPIDSSTKGPFYYPSLTVIRPWMNDYVFSFWGFFSGMCLPQVIAVLYLSSHYLKGRANRTPTLV